MATHDPAKANGKTRQVFQVVVDSALPGEDTRKLLDQLINIGLADAASTLEDLDEDSPMGDDARAVLDMDIHAPEEVFFVLDANKGMIPVELVETREERGEVPDPEGPAGP